MISSHETVKHLISICVLHSNTSLESTPVASCSTFMGARAMERMMLNCCLGLSVRMLLSVGVMRRPSVVIKSAPP